jgi:hypothetical protein
MRNARARAKVRVKARVSALPQNWDLTLWSIGTLLSAAMLYIALVR